MPEYTRYPALDETLKFPPAVLLAIVQSPQVQQAIADVVTGTGNMSLSELSDVSIAEPSEGQVLTYRSGQWSSGDVDETGVAYLDDLVDVAVSEPEEGQVLTYFEDQWVALPAAVPETNPFEGLNIVTNYEGDRFVIVYDNEGWQDKYPTTFPGPPAPVTTLRII